MKALKSYSNYTYIFGIFIFALILNFLTPLRGDDFGYQLISENGNEKFRSLSQIINFQFYEYFNTGGRVIVHTIVQIFVNLLGKPLFNLFNALFLALYFYITSRSVTQNTDIKRSLTLIVASFILFLPNIDETIFWLSGSVNYLWSTTICIIFAYIFFSNERLSQICSSGNIVRFGFMLLSFLAGWSQEGIVVGLGAAIVLFIVINYKNLSSFQIITSLLFFIGSILLIMAPGNFARLENMNSDESVSISVTSSGLSYILLYIKKCIINIEALHLTLILILSLFVTLIVRKNRFIKFIDDNKYLITIVVIEYSFISFCGHTSGRAMFGIESVSLILLVRLMYEYDFKFLYKNIIYKTVNTCIILFIVTIGILSYNNLMFGNEVLREIEKGNKIVAQVPSYGILDKYILSIAERKENQHNAEYWENILLSRYYNLPYLVMLPEELINRNNLNDIPEISNGCYTKKEWSFILKRDEIDSSENRLYDVCYNLNEINETESFSLKKIIKPLLNKNRNNTEITITNGASTLKIGETGYYLVSKPNIYDFDNRLKNIEIIRD